MLGGADKESITTTKSLTFSQRRTRSALYGKFKKSKDVSSYGSSNMDEILGRRAGELEHQAPNEVLKSDIKTVKGNVSIQEYFSSKMKTRGKTSILINIAIKGYLSLILLI